MHSTTIKVHLGWEKMHSTAMKVHLDQDKMHSIRMKVRTDRGRLRTSRIKVRTSATTIGLRGRKGGLEQGNDGRSLGETGL